MSVLVVQLHSKLIKELYCGEFSCYDVLNVERNASKMIISKAYRNLAKIYHPDLAKTDDQRNTFSDKFQEIAKAYETLRDDGVREDYNQYLDDPTAYYKTYYKYYRRRLSPKVDVRIVIAAFVIVASGIQYYIQHSTYEQTMNSFLNVPKFKNQAMQIARQQGLLINDRKEKRSFDRTEIKYRQDIILKEIIAKELGADRVLQPSLKRIFVIQFACLPYTIIRYFVWLIHWYVKHSLMNIPLTVEEKLYLIRKNMRLSDTEFKLQYGGSGDYDKLLNSELWDSERYKAWADEQEEIRQRRLMQSGRYKSYQRWLKSGSASQITFDPD
ncbi:hypothetical protein GJ496_010522 [Pomphorhynchus laevis]|nr:hypothetical protein GJ496_010522 [Pomphorhynchus laevis]